MRAKTGGPLCAKFTTLKTTATWITGWPSCLAGDLRPGLCRSLGLPAIRDATHKSLATVSLYIFQL